MDKNFYSPTMLVNYVNLKHFITDEFGDEILNLKKSERTIAENLRLEKGLIHEKDYFNELSKKYKKIKNIKKLKDLPKEEKIKETIQALKNGYELVYGGWLASGNWRGELDFLEINKTVKSNFGDWSYEIIDTKNTSKVKKDHIYQISLYSFLLKEAQGILPKNFYILLKDKKKEIVRISEVYDIFLEQKLSFENFVKNDLNRKKLEKVSYCSFRDLQEFCEKEWINKKHLNQVLGNNKNNIKRLNEAGIKNFSELSKLDPKKKN